jgi:membrane-associated protein
MSLFHLLTDPITIIKTVGLVGIFCIIFAESGLFFGFFLPGDSLLFTAGFLASQGLIPTGWIFLGLFIAAVLGYHVGYVFGKRVGPALFTKERSLFFNKKYPEQAKFFYEKYGSRAIIFGRFIPIVRTFVPIMAGVGDMKYRTFFLYNIVGGAGWTILITAAGFFLGTSIPHADSYIEPIIILIILISCIPPAYHFFKRRQKKNVVY